MQFQKINIFEIKLFKIDIFEKQIYEIDIFGTESKNDNFEIPNFI